MIPYERIPNDHILRLGATGAYIKHLETFISDDECTVRFGDILMFATGMETFPPLGVHIAFKLGHLALSHHCMLRILAYILTTIKHC